MEKQEFRAAASLAAVFSVRLLGLFMIYPVFADYAHSLSGATPYTIGLALGIYGLSQGLLQIPFGLLSDKIGRKFMIVLGLSVFGAGSVVAAVSTSIDGVIVGRALQGAGAVGSVILALVADLTGEEIRTKAMAMVGITIGMSFMVALVAGPMLAGVFGVSGIFTLHAMLTASFLVVPSLLKARLNVNSHSQWQVYLPVLLLSIAVMVPAIIIAEKYRRMKGVFIGAVAALAANQFMLVVGESNVYVVLTAITFFFAGFNVMEASLPSLVTKTAPPDAKGTAAGIYSSAQFLGIFVGVVVGGWVHQVEGSGSVFAWSGVLALLWLLVAVTMKQPSYLTTRLIRIGDGCIATAADLAAKLRQLPGVAEAIVVIDENLAYLKVDSKTFDAAGARSLVDAS
jgi:MFS family permease